MQFSAYYFAILSLAYFAVNHWLILQFAVFHWLINELVIDLNFKDWSIVLTFVPFGVGFLQ